MNKEQEQLLGVLEHIKTLKSQSESRAFIAGYEKAIKDLASTKSESNTTQSLTWQPYRGFDSVIQEKQFLIRSETFNGDCIYEKKGQDLWNISCEEILDDDFFGGYEVVEILYIP